MFITAFLNMQHTAVTSTSTERNMQKEGVLILFMLCLHSVYAEYSKQEVSVMTCIMLEFSVVEVSLICCCVIWTKKANLTIE